MGKYKSFWSYACLFFLGQACENETQNHVLSIPPRSLPPQRWVRHVHVRQQRGVQFHPLSFGCFPNILSHPQPPTPLLISLLVPPADSSASHLPAHLSSKHICYVSLSPSHSYDLGVRVAPTPSQPRIKLPCHYSVVPPARVLHVRHSGACPPARRLPLRTCGLVQFNHRRPWSVESLQLWHTLPGKLCR